MFTHHFSYFRLPLKNNFHQIPIKTIHILTFIKNVFLSYFTMNIFEEVIRIQQTKKNRKYSYCLEKKGKINFNVHISELKTLNIKYI